MSKAEISARFCAVWVLTIACQASSISSSPHFVEGELQKLRKHVLLHLHLAELCSWNQADPPPPIDTLPQPRQSATCVFCCIWCCRPSGGCRGFLDPVITEQRRTIPPPRRPTANTTLPGVFLYTPCPTASLTAAGHLGGVEASWIPL